MGPLVNILSDIGTDMTNLEDMKPVWTYHSRIELETPVENSYYGNSVDHVSYPVIIGSYKELHNSSLKLLVNCGKAYIYNSDLSEIGHYINISILDKTGRSLFGSIVKIDNTAAVISSYYQVTVIQVEQHMLKREKYIFIIMRRMYMEV